MKTVIFIAALFSVWARAEDDISKAFQSEYVYLASQKEALVRQKRQMQEAFKQRITQSKARVHRLQFEVTGLTSQNDDLHEHLLELEKKKKELARRGSSLETTYKKAFKILSDAERGLRFESTKDKTEIVAPADINVTALGPLFKKADTLLRASSRAETFDGVYLDQEDKLAEGKVTRIGRVAAFVQGQDGDLALGPNGTGNLKALDRVSRGNIFVFDNMNEAARLQRPATWLERLADAGPILFLAIMLAMVAGLFFVLVKI